MGERSSWGVSHGRSGDYVPSGSVDNDPPNNWAAFCDLQGRVQRDGVGQLKGTQVGKAFCDKLDGLVAAGKFNKDIILVEDIIGKIVDPSKCMQVPDHIHFEEVNALRVKIMTEYQ